ncbi:MAG: DUF4399 domain-containing protein [Microcystis aeruginosa Ma_MB_F_20061100_S19]|nr:MAG: DUF4399 domain-containing protein [Microcystis aeruginosa Ma_MB_F_20061100_S19]
MKLLKILAIFSFISLSINTFAQTSSVDFAEPKDGEVVSSPFKVKFTVEGMTVAPAGTKTPDTGHHHLLINAENIKAGEVIPADEKHLHFGKGQTETIVTLPPGKYKLTLQFANGLHESYGEAMSKSIEVEVK